MSSPYDHYFWQLRELQRALELLTPQRPAIEALPKQFLDQINEFRRLEETFTLPTQYLEDLNRTWEQLTRNPVLEELTQLASRVDGVLAELQEHQRALGLSARRVGDLWTDIRPPSEALVTALVPVEALLRSVEMGERALEAATLPHRAFQEFARQQLDLVGATTSEIANAARLRYVDAAGELLEDMTKGLELGLLMAPQFARSGPDVEWEANVFAGLAARADAAAFEDAEFEARSFVLASPEASTVDLGQRLMRLVFDLNSEAEREQREPPFKATTKTVWAGALITSHLATDQESFDRIVDQLYFLLYEGSSCARRIQDRWRDADLEALWRLKHLRREARHDLEHGDKTDIKAKRRATAEALSRLAGVVMPKTGADWCRAQQALYEQLVAMLQRLWDRDDGDGNDG